MMNRQDFELESSHDPVSAPKRVALVQRHDSLRVETEPEEIVMTVPHLVIREVIAFQVLVAALAVFALLIDAPLEQLADPMKTPNPAKAPWYFLGLQELLHYFPPVVAGVLVPVLVVISLVVIPYFQINVQRPRLWDRTDRRTLLWFGAVALALLGFLALFGVWPVIVSSLVASSLMTLCLWYPRESGWWGWVCRLSVPSWIMIWFVLSASALTLIGVAFRGPGWSWVWPWQ